MQLRTSCFVAAGVLTFGLAAIASADFTPLEQVKALETNLKFEDLFPRRPFSGQTAGIQGWSHDDRYLAYVWNPLDTPGRDLYLFDSRTGKSERLTTIDMMAKFDSQALKAKAEFEETQKRLATWETLSLTELREVRQKFKEDEEKRREPRPSYPGISSVTWANKANEFLFTYRGDIFRWKVGDKEPTRLTDTRDGESNVEYLPDDKGFVFQRGQGAYRMRFDSPVVVQITPELKDGVNFGGYSISPNGETMLVFGNKPGQPGRQVDYIVYRGRFAEARKTPRGVAEDDFSGESRIYLFDIREATLTDKSKENEPLEIWKWAGGEEWQETAISAHPWSPDGSRFVFGSWKRDKAELEILEADLKTKKIESIYKGTSAGEHGTPGLADPKYNKDGSAVIAMLDLSGWRHLHILDRKGGHKPLTSGEFEVYPLQLSADKESMLVSSSKDSLARREIFRVNIASGKMDKLSITPGNYSQPSFAHKSDKFAAIQASWSQMREMFVVEGANERRITDSHRSEKFWNVVKQKPELFNFNNRHGDKIHGFRFLPPGYAKGQRRPLFIYVYGGPLGTSNSVSDGAFGSTDYMFAMYLTQVLGYITVTIDPRGQSGYSARFGRANWEAPGVAQTEDIVDLIKYMEAEYTIDRSKVGLTGWSFGGFQTQHTMYTEPGWVTLGIAGAGPTEWQNYNTWYSGGVIGNAPKGKPEEIDKFSLTHVAKNLKDPLLLLHGMEDTNVLYQDTVKVYRKLLQAGKGPLVELSLDPTGGHGMGGDMDNRDRHEIYLAFILKHWGLPPARY